MSISTRSKTTQHEQTSPRRSKRATIKKSSSPPSPKVRRLGRRRQTTEGVHNERLPPSSNDAERSITPGPTDDSIPLSYLLQPSMISEAVQLTCTRPPTIASDTMKELEEAHTKLSRTQEALSTRDTFLAHLQMDISSIRQGKLSEVEHLAILLPVKHNFLADSLELNNKLRAAQSWVKDLDVIARRQKEEISTLQDANASITSLIGQNQQVIDYKTTCIQHLTERNAALRAKWSESAPNAVHLLRDLEFAFQDAISMHGDFVGIQSHVLALQAGVEELGKELTQLL